MSMSNEELIRKATITTQAMVDSGAGLMNAEQANQFIDYVIDETVIGSKARVVRFKAAQRLIEKINVANRVAVPKQEATDPGVRRGVSTSKVVLEHHEIMVPFEIGDILLEENIEEGKLEQHIIKMMATRLANNIEELYWDGNTTGPAVLESEYREGGSASLYVKDSYLSLFNGWLRNAESGHVVDAAGANVAPAAFNDAIIAMPNKFKKNKAQLKFMLSPDHEQGYRDTVGSRATQTGDNMLADKGNVPAYGIEVMPISLMNSTPMYVEDSVANSDGTTATALSHAPISDLVLTTQTLDGSPESQYVVGVDYTVDEVNGTWTRLTGGSIGAGATVKATYSTLGKILLTNPQNMIIAIGRDIRLESDRNIFKTVSEFALTVKIFCTFEETDAVVLVKNLAIS